MKKRRKRKKKKKIVKQDYPPPVVPYVVACSKTINEVDSLLEYPSQDYIEKWKVGERKSYAILLIHRDKYHKVLRLSGSFMMDMVVFKNILFSRHQKPIPLDLISDFVVITSNLYLSLVSLYEIFGEWVKDLFVVPEDENFDFVAYRLLMRQYLKLEQVIRKYEEDLATSVNQIAKLRPKIDKIENDNRITEQRIERLEKRNEELEKQVSNLTAQKLDQQAEIKRKEKESKLKISVENSTNSNQKSRDLEDGGSEGKEDVEIDMMENRMIQFEKMITYILSEKENKIHDDSQAKLYSMQVKIMHIIKRFQSLKSSLYELNREVTEMMKKKLNSGKSQKHERRGYNLKINAARRHLETLKMVIDEFKVGERHLQNDNILANSDRIFCLDMVLKDQGYVHRTTEVLNEILKPINPKESISDQLESLENKFGGKELRQKYKKEVKKDKVLMTKIEKEEKKREDRIMSRKKRFLERKKERHKKLLESNVPLKEHKRIVNDLIQKFRQSENHYRRKLKSLLSKLGKHKKKKKKKKQQLKASSENKMKNGLLSPVSNSLKFSKSASLINQNNKENSKLQKNKKNKKRLSLPEVENLDEFTSGSKQSDKKSKNPKKSKSMNSNRKKKMRKKTVDNHSLKSFSQINLDQANSLEVPGMKRLKSTTTMRVRKRTESTTKKEKKELEELGKIFDEHIIGNELDEANEIQNSNNNELKDPKLESSEKIEEYKNIEKNESEKENKIVIERTNEENEIRKRKSYEKLEEALNKLAGDDELKRKFIFKQRIRMDRIREKHEKIKEQFTRKNPNKKKLKELELKLKREEKKIAEEMKKQFIRRRKYEYIRNRKLKESEIMKKQREDRRIQRKSNNMKLFSEEKSKVKINIGNIINGEEDGKVDDIGLLFSGGSGNSRENLKASESDLLQFLRVSRKQEESEKQKEKEKQEREIKQHLEEFEKSRKKKTKKLVDTSKLFVPRFSSTKDIDSEDSKAIEKKDDDKKEMQNDEVNHFLEKGTTFGVKKRRPTSPPRKLLFPKSEGGNTKEELEINPNLKPLEEIEGEGEIKQGESEGAEDEENKTEKKKKVYVIITVKIRGRIYKYKIPKIETYSGEDWIPKLVINDNLSPRSFFREKIKEDAAEAELSKLETDQLRQVFFRNKNDFNSSLDTSVDYENEFDSDFNRPRRKGLSGDNRKKVGDGLEYETQKKLKDDFNLRKKLQRMTEEQKEEDRLRQRIFNLLNSKNEEDGNKVENENGTPPENTENEGIKTDASVIKEENGELENTETEEEAESETEEKNDGGDEENLVLSKQLEEFEKKRKLLKNARKNMLLEMNSPTHSSTDSDIFNKKDERKRGEVPINVLLSMPSIFGKKKAKKNRKKKSEDRNKKNENIHSQVVNITLPTIHVKPKNFEKSKKDEPFLNNNNNENLENSFSSQSFIDHDYMSGTYKDELIRQGMKIKESKEKEGWYEVTPSKIPIRFVPPIRDSFSKEQSSETFQFGGLNNIRVSRFDENTQNYSKNKKIRLFRKDSKGTLKLPALFSTSFQSSPKKKSKSKVDSDLFNRIQYVVDRQKEMQKYIEDPSKKVSKIIFGGSQSVD